MTAVKQYYSDSCIIVPPAFSFHLCPVFFHSEAGHAHAHMWNDMACGTILQWGGGGTALLFHTDAHTHMWNNITCGTKK